MEPKENLIKILFKILPDRTTIFLGCKCFMFYSIWSGSFHSIESPSFRLLREIPKKCMGKEKTQNSSTHPKSWFSQTRIFKVCNRHYSCQKKKQWWLLSSKIIILTVGFQSLLSLESKSLVCPLSLCPIKGPPNYHGRWFE